MSLSMKLDIILAYHIAKITSVLCQLKTVGMKIWILVIMAIVKSAKNE